MVTILNGLVGGFIATVVMTVFMMALGDDSPPPTALLWSKYVGDGSPEEYMMQGMVLHLIYGTGAGSVLAWLGTAGLIAVLSLDTVVGGLVNGVIYGILLFAVAVPVWMRGVLGMDADPAQMGMMGLFHVIYGAVLGVWLGLGVL